MTRETIFREIKDSVGETQYQHWKEQIRHDYHRQRGVKCTLQEYEYAEMVRRYANVKTDKNLGLEATL